MLVNSMGIGAINNSVFPGADQSAVWLLAKVMSEALSQSSQHMTNKEQKFLAVFEVIDTIS